MTVNVIVYRLPNKIKDIVNGLINKDQYGNYYGHYVEDTEQPLVRQSISGTVHQRNEHKTMHSTRERAQLQNFTDSYNYLMND
jgi:hypothetical protein